MTGRRSRGVYIQIRSLCKLTDRTVAANQSVPDPEDRARGGGLGLCPQQGCRGAELPLGVWKTKPPTMKLEY